MQVILLGAWKADKQWERRLARLLAAALQRKWDRSSRGLPAAKREGPPRGR